MQCNSFLTSSKSSKGTYPLVRVCYTHDSPGGVASSYIGKCHINFIISRVALKIITWYHHSKNMMMMIFRILEFNSLYLVCVVVDTILVGFLDQWESVCQREYLRDRGSTPWLTIRQYGRKRLDLGCVVV